MRNHGLGSCIEGSLDAKASGRSLGGALGLLFGVLGVSWSQPEEVPRGLGEARRPGDPLQLLNMIGRLRGCFQGLMEASGEALVADGC